MISFIDRSLSYCFGRNLTLYIQATRPATPRTEPRFRTAHPGGLLVLGQRVCGTELSHEV